MAILIPLLILSRSVYCDIGDKNRADTIGWGVYSDQPPVFIIEGIDKGNGIADNIYVELQRHLPEFQHHQVQAKLLRIIAMISAKEKICAVMFKTPERESMMRFSSVAVGWLSSPRLAVASDRLDEFHAQTGWQNGEISLREMIEEHPNLRLGLNTGSSYGNTLDDKLKGIGRHNRIYRHSGFNSTRALLHMLLAGRVDYILEHSWVIKFVLKGDLNKVTLIPLTGAPDYVEVFVGCPRNSWGQSVIRRIDPLIAEVRNRSAARIENWLPEYEISNYRKSFQAKFGGEHY
nr:TIGR02285 family protein [Pseudomaricurvus alkylphenolicus]